MSSRSLPAGFIPPCLPTKAPRPPSGDAWLHEIKHDGFRVIARKDGPRVKLYSRPGNDLTDRFPLIVEGPGASALAVLLHRWRGRRLQRERPRIVRSHSSPPHR
jgi:ATP dependent DNA ligase domain